MDLESLEQREVLSLLPPVVTPDANFNIVADFNGDGRTDIVVTDYGSNSIRLRLGSGDGTFQSAHILATGVRPLTAADINRDGNLDLLTKQTSELSVLLGNGNGTFQSPRNTSLPKVDGRAQTVDSIAVGDLNRDGKLDLTVTSGGPWSGVFSFWRRTNLHSFLGIGDGSFRLKNTILLDSDGQSSLPVLGDYSGDGKLDVMTSEYSGSQTNWYSRLGKGDGTFGSRKSVGEFSGRISAVVAADINGDGRSDLVAANPTGNDVRVFLSSGAGNFSAPSNYGVGTSPAALAIADLDRDGRHDIVTSNSGSGTVSVLLGNGAGGFQAAREFAAGSNPSTLGIGDVDADGWLDVTVGNSSGLSVLMNSGQW